MQNKEIVQFSIRIPLEEYRRLKFIAADRDTTINALILSAIRGATAKARVSVPTDLLREEAPPSQ